MKKIVYLTLIIAGLTACSGKQSGNYIPDSSEIRGLATPIQLNGTINEVILEDYFLDVSKIDSISVCPEIDFLISSDKKHLRLIASNSNIPQLSELKVWMKNTPYSILVKKSNKIPILLSYDSKGRKVKKVQVKGQFNSWNPNADTMKYSNGLWQATLLVNPGKYQYIFIVDGKELLDPANPVKEENGIGGYNSVIVAGNIDKSKQPFLFANTAEKGKLNIGYTSEISKVFAFWENYRIPDENISFDEKNLCIKFPDISKKFKRSHLRIWAYNDFGVSNDLLIPLKRNYVVSRTNDLTRSDLQSQVMYFLMVDRFNNGNTQNDKKVDDPEVLPKANYFGGDLAGVTQKIREGYFDTLGINTIWLSPITQNPMGAWGLNINPRSKFSGYHGYWPISLSKVDTRFGTSNELHELVNTAHNDNINILLDYVANHVHQEHPMAKAHPDWFSSLYLPDGSMNLEKWEEYRLTTWFDTFLPKFNFEKPEVYEPLSDSVLFWLKVFDIDGFRHDATKHIHENFWRRVTYKIKHQLPASKSVYQIGETYGGPELIKSYIGSGLLDSQFDFNVYDAALNSIANPNGSFVNLNAKISESLDFYGYHNLMGYISGNQDRGRFISYAGGSLKFDENAKYAGWTRDIEVGDTVGYNRLCMLNAFNMTIPGIPTIYYGDEYGMPGGNDPDNRRMMKFNELNDFERKTLKITKKIIHLRRENIALNYGEFLPLFVDNDFYAYARIYLDNKVIVLFNKNIDTRKFTIDLSDFLVSDSYKSEFNSQFIKRSNKLEITLKGNSFEVLVSN